MADDNLIHSEKHRVPLSSKPGGEQPGTAPLWELSEQELHRQLRDLATLTAVSMMLNSTLDPKEVLCIIVSAVRQVIGCQKSAIFDLDHTGTVLSLRMNHGLGDDFIQAAQSLPVDSWWTDVVVTQEVVAVSDVAADPRLSRFAALADAEDIRAFVDLPLVVQGQIVGSLAIYFTEPRTFTDFELELLTIFANQAASAIHNARRYDAALQERNLVQAIVAGMADGVVVTDAESNVVMRNQAAEEMLGIQMGQRWFVDLPSRKLSGLAGALPETGGPALTGDRWQTTLKRAGRVLSVSMTPLPNDGSRNQGAVYVIRDITHWAEQDQVKSDFISQVSHDLRTPLTTIKTLVDLLRKGGQDGAKVREYLDIIEAEVNRQVQLVNDLLEVGQLETGEVNWTVVEVSMNDVTELAIRACLPLAEEKRIELTGRPLPTLPKVMGTPRRLQQVLVNLLSNAIKYTPPGGRVTVEGGSDEDTVWVAVRDTGPGIPQSDLPRVFDKFYRARRDRHNQEGVGLGLAIAWQIIEMLKGTIEVESEVGRGSCFTVRLPRARKMMAAMKDKLKGVDDERTHSADR
jgi:two-component system phosphate regulon sensor histidine kinase PhoR